MSIKTWKPTPRQSEFLSLPDAVFEALYGGAAGGGKTETLEMLPVVKKTKLDTPLYEHPRFKMLYLRRTFPELDSEVIPRSKDIYPAFGFQPYQDQKRRWTHPSGAIIQFGHCEHEKDVKKYDTAEYNIIAFDEATSFTPYQYEYLTFSRCRSASADLPAIVRSGTNPGNIGHGYFRDRFVKPHKQGGVILKESRLVDGVSQTLLRYYCPSKATDNTYLMQADPDYINRLNRLPEAERAAKADGDWWTFSGQVFDDFRVEPFPDEPAAAQHVITPFRIPEYWPKLISIDWGFAAMTICGWYAINPCPTSKYPAKIYKYREYSCKQTKISTWASDIARLSQGETYCDVVLDPSAWGDKGDELNIADQFSNVSGFRPRRADNNRISGKILIQEFLRWKPRPPKYIPQEGFDHELALKIRRISGEKSWQEYVALFTPEEVENFLPKFQIFDTCEQTIKALPLCVYDKNKVEDVAEFEGDDPYDETRYGLKACQNYLTGGLEEHKQDTERARILAEFEQTKNVNHFYRQMASVDANENATAFLVKKFHRSKFMRQRHANF